ncbi:MAG: M15 family metallopeptidase [Rubricoccaceae bacterium]
MEPEPPSVPNRPTPPASTPDNPTIAPPPGLSPPAPIGAPSPERPALPDGFVRLSEFAPEIAQEIRYTTAFNFVGEPIDAYNAPECILTTQAASALKQVAADLAEQDLGLKVYDCYRPQTAVNHFVRWARTDDRTMKPAFYPDVSKNRLFADGYIASRSGHSRGSTVDLTLVHQPVAESIVPERFYPTPGNLPRCDRPLPDRFAERDLDMGSAYDCLSPISATASRAVSAEARRNRQTLKAAMDRRGFRNYSKEWWHFTLRGEPYTNTYHDFPVE